METHTFAGMVVGAADLRVAIDAIWILLLGFFALMAQAGFALLGTGMVRTKNAAHAVAMVLLSYCAGILGFALLGFRLQTGHGMLFASSGMSTSAAGAFVSCVVLASIAAAIPSGVLAERWKLRSVALFGFVAAAVVYPVFAHWVWGGGWLGALGVNFGLGHGVVDCAGSSVVHMTGGMVALVAAKMIGPRLGKYTPRGEVRPIPAHNMPLVVLGTFLLAAGWSAIAVASTLAGKQAWAGAMAANLVLASAVGGISAFVHTRIRFGKPDLSLMCNGLLAGVVSIGAPGIFVGPVAAIAIGLVASLLAIEGALFVERKLHIDDPVGAGAVHGLGGAWGLLAVGLFADGRAGEGLNGVAGAVKGLLLGGGGQLAASLVGILANVLWVGLATAILAWVVGRTVGNRASADDEIAGLDVPELGMTGYVNEGVHATATRSSDIGHGRK
jgi:Amt family ammonium transporter